MGAARALAPLAIVERFEQGAAGTRHRWTYAVCAMTDRGPLVLREERGEGPLGRLRARQRALDYCARTRTVAEEHRVEVEHRGPISRSMFRARLLGRLREQGVL